MFEVSQVESTVKQVVSVQYKLVLEIRESIVNIAREQHLPEL